jgi:hypothetical protein
MWTFNNGLYSSIKEIAPVVSGMTIREKQLKIDEMNNIIGTNGKHSRGIQINDSDNPQYLKYMLPDNIKTISFWFKSNTPEEVDMGTPRVLIGQTTANGVDTTTDPYWLCYITRTSEVIKNIVCLKLATPTTVYHCKVNKDVLDGKWHHVVIEFNIEPTPIFNISGMVSRLWVDGIYAETALEEQLNPDGTRIIGPYTGYITPFIFYNSLNPFYFRIGHQDDSGESNALSNCTYDDLITYTKHYDKDTILSWYISNSEPYLPYDYLIEAQDDYDKIPLGPFTYDNMEQFQYFQLFQFTYNRLQGEEGTYLTWDEFDALSALLQESMTWDELEQYKP